MLGLQWKKVIPNMVSSSFVRVTDEIGAPVVAGAFQRKSSDHFGLARLSLANDGFVPGVYDFSRKKCIVGDEGLEEDFYVLSKCPSIQFDWIAEQDGCIPAGALQCGFGCHGEPLYVGRFTHEGKILCGPVNAEEKKCQVNVLGEKYSSNRYEVLCMKTVPIGLNYGSMYNLRSQMTPPTPVSTPTSSSNSITTHFNGTPSPVGLTASWPKNVSVSRTVTSSQTVTVRKTGGLQNGTTTVTTTPATPIAALPSPISTPVTKSAPIDNSTPTTSRKREAKTKWERLGNGSRLIRSPMRAYRLK